MHRPMSAKTSPIPPGMRRKRAPPERLRRRLGWHLEEERHIDPERDQVVLGAQVVGRRTPSPLVSDLRPDQKVAIREVVGQAESPTGIRRLETGALAIFVVHEVIAKRDIVAL